MKKKQRIIPVLFLAAVTAVGGSFLFSEEGPRIVFEESQWDFGKVKEGAVLTHNFVFRNNGDSSLIIQRVKTSCGCTAALASTQEIPPGQKGEIQVKFHTRGYAGNVSKFIFVESNDSDQPRKRLVVSADIEVPPRPQIQIRNLSQDVGLILEGEALSTQTTIVNKGERKLRVEFSHKQAAFFHKGKEIDSSIAVAPGKKVDIEIKIPALQKKGLLREYVMIESNDPRRPRMSLYISGYVVTQKQLKELFDKYKKQIKQ